MDIWLSTTDNPYNPIDDYDSWNNYDTQKGYHTPEFLDRLITARGVDLSQLSDSDERAYLESLIDDVVKNTRAYTPIVTADETVKYCKVIKSGTDASDESNKESSVG
jgi:hypothetical protein|nr:MAG TPA: hypothetical protein [Caudoviricetes sp.]